MKNYLLKWIQTMRVAWANYLTYRINFFLQVIGPALVFFFIKYNLWSSIYGVKENLVIQNYTFTGMINYHIWALIVGLLAQGHTAMNLAEDIRLGRISSYLVYPFNFWEFHTANFLAFQILQIFVSLVTIGALYFFGLLEFHGQFAFVQGYVYTIYVSIFWFCLQYLTGMMAFWLEETWILRVIIMMITAFFSGAIIPLDLFPPNLVEVLNYTPFPYLTFYPIKIFMGEFSAIGIPYMVLTIWILIFMFINHLLWRRGLKLYTAAGM
jgi:ABC-2 type transport system permease protein